MKLGLGEGRGRGRESLIFHTAQDEHDPGVGAAGGDINRSRVPLPHPAAAAALALLTPLRRKAVPARYRVSRVRSAVGQRTSNVATSCR